MLAWPLGVDRGLVVDLEAQGPLGLVVDLTVGAGLSALDAAVSVGDLVGVAAGVTAPPVTLPPVGLPPLLAELEIPPVAVPPVLPEPVVHR